MKEKFTNWWNVTCKPALIDAGQFTIKVIKALAAFWAAFYMAKIHPILTLQSSPEKRAIAAGRYLTKLAMIYGILSIVGAIIMALISNEGECVLRYSFSDDCYGYATERPFLTWAIVSLLISLIVASFLYAFGSYVEAKMKKQLKEG